MYVSLPSSSGPFLTTISSDDIIPTLSPETSVCIISVRDPLHSILPRGRPRCSSCGECAAIHACQVPHVVPRLGSTVVADTSAFDHSGVAIPQSSSTAISVDKADTSLPHVSTAEHIRGGASSPDPEPSSSSSSSSSSPSFYDSCHDFTLDFVEEGLHMSSPTISPAILNSWYSFVSCGTLLDVSTGRSSRSQYHVLVLVRDVITFLSQCTFLTRANVQRIAQLHGVSFPKTRKRTEWATGFANHVCDATCSVQYVLLARLKARRTSAEKVRHGTRMFRVQPSDNSPGEAVVASSFNTFRVDAVAAVDPEPEPPLGVNGVYPVQGDTNHDDGDELIIPTFDYHEPYPAFPEIRDESFKVELIDAYQKHMDLSNFEWRACAVCGQQKFKSELQCIHPEELDLTLLRNDGIPYEARPSTYDFELYDRALLDVVGLSDPYSLQDMSVCDKCLSSLNNGKQPLNSLANHQYYGLSSLPPDVEEAFRTSTMMERQLVSACRATSISCTYKADKHSRGPRQRYCQGNVAIIPQDICSLRRILPPTLEDARELMCVLFVGNGVKPSVETVKKIGPCLVSRRRVEIMIRFLCEHNPHYRRLGISFSEANLDAICSGPGFRPGDDMGVPATIEVQHLPQVEDATEAVTSRYDNSGTAPFIVPPGAVFTQITGFAGASQGAITDSQMKARALKWCLDGRSFLNVRAGDRLFPDRDPRMLTFVFPHLDPWGIGGFNNPARHSSQALSMQHQTKNLLEMYNSPFKRDPSFPYVCWNAIQKLDVSSNLQFRAEEKHLLKLVDEVAENVDVLNEMTAKWEADQTQLPSTRREKRIARLIDKLAVAAKDLKGSNGRKLAMRNHIRSMFKSCGCPALFLTLNPADVYSPLMQTLAGINLDTFSRMSAFERAKIVADNPDAAAKFFDFMITAFRDYILRANKAGGGLFGDCFAHFGTVEAQGRGTLHCHMLIWIRGNPNPQALRDRLAVDPGFKQALFGWLESIIKCELPGMQPVMADGAHPEMDAPDIAVDPRTVVSPPVPEGMTEAELEVFQANFQQFVTDAAIACNWHEHRDTCFKHLKKGEPRNSDTCRMRMNGHTRNFTELHPETQEILLRRLHPWINNYNDVVLFLQRCNMDIKYIGSGVDAKAFAFYVTDYITKPGLPLYLALQALSWAVKQNGVKFNGRSDASDLEIKRSLLTKIVNSMMGRQELSHQQVMSYLIGGGDCYKSHDFRVLYWVELDKFISGSMSSTPNIADDSHRPAENANHTSEDVVGDGNIEIDAAPPDAADDLDGEESGDSDNEQPNSDQPKKLVRLSRYGIARSGLLEDYTLRSDVKHFEDLCVWDFVALVEKQTIRSADARKERQQNRTDHGDRERRSRSKKRKAMTLSTPVKYLNDSHPSFHTHVSYLRSQSRLLPVPVGPPIPRKDRSPEEYERCCRTLLILFKPWRTELDLRHRGEAWSTAYARTTFPPHIQFVIQNIHLEHECKDARDSYAQQRRVGRARAFFDDDEPRAFMDNNGDQWHDALHNDPRLEQALIFGPASDNNSTLGDSLRQRHEDRNDANLHFLLETLESAGVIDSQLKPVLGPMRIDGLRTDEEQFPESLVESHRAVMEAFSTLR